MCITGPTALPVIALTTSRDQQDIVHVSDHTLFEQANSPVTSQIVYPSVFKASVKGDPVGIL